MRDKSITVSSKKSQQILKELVELEEAMAKAGFVVGT